jgi:hypothetical protein
MYSIPFPILPMPKSLSIISCIKLWVIAIQYKLDFDVFHNLLVRFSSSTKEERVQDTAKELLEVDARNNKTTWRKP